MPSNVQPLSEVLHWDGRLDNRSDLLLRLSLPRESSNQAIARAAYDRWGTEGLVQLIGDWSPVVGGGQAVMVDPKSQARMAAADPRRDGYGLAY